MWLFWPYRHHSHINALAEHFQKELSWAPYRGYTPPQPLDEPVFVDLVFTHNDLNMRNILLDQDGQLWIVDWGWAGFYPMWFEYVGMWLATQKDGYPDDWQTAIKFMIEPLFDMEIWMASIGYTFLPVPSQNLGHSSSRWVLTNLLQCFCLYINLHQLNFLFVCLIRIS